MYILTILAIIFSTFYMLMMTSEGLGALRNFVDFPSFLLLLLIAIPIMASTKLLKDFSNAFKFALGKKGEEVTLIAVRRAMEAVELMRKLLLFGGGFVFLMGCIVMLHQLVDPASVGPTLAIASVAAIYAMVGNLLLLPIASRLKIKMIEFVQE